MCQGQDPLIGLRPPACMIQAPELTGVKMSNLFWLTDEQMERLKPFVGKTVHWTVF